MAGSAPSEETLKIGPDGRNGLGYTPDEYKKFRRHAWAYLALFSLMYCSIYCCRLNLSNASAMMMEGLNWTTSDIGIVTSTLFWTYALGQLVNGRLSEIVGYSKFILLSVVLSIAANLFVSLQSSLWIIAIAWGLNGWFQSMAWTPGLTAITKWWVGNTRGFATGIAHAFSGFGQCFATLSVALAFTLFPDMGWRAAFVVPAAVPALFFILYMVFTKPSPSAAGLPEYKEDDPEKAAFELENKRIIQEHGKLYPYIHLLKNRRFCVWLLIAFLTGLARYGLVIWIPLYFVQVFQTDVTAGLLESLAVPVGMGVGSLIVPWITDCLCPHDRLPAAIISGIGAATCMMAFFLLEPGLLVEILLFLTGFFIYAINGIAWTFATDIGGRVFSATAGGMVDAVAYVGAAIQSLVFGFFLNTGGWSVLFVSLSMSCLLISVLGIADRQYQKHKDSEAAEAVK